MGFEASFCKSEDAAASPVKLQLSVYVMVCMDGDYLREGARRLRELLLQIWWQCGLDPQEVVPVPAHTVVRHAALLP